MPRQASPVLRAACLASRYTVEETVELLRILGFRNLDVIEAHGITGADLLELDEHELRDELKVPHLQVCQSACPDYPCDKMIMKRHEIASPSPLQAI